MTGARALGLQTRFAAALDGVRAGGLQPEHVTELLGTARKIVEARLAIAGLEAATSQKIRALRAELQDDLGRADHAVGILREFCDRMPDEDVAALTTAIIKVTLGVRTDR